MQPLIQYIILFVIILICWIPTRADDNECITIYSGLGNGTELNISDKINICIRLKTDQFDVLDIDPIEEQVHFSLFIHQKNLLDENINVDIPLDYNEIIDMVNNTKIFTYFIYNPPDELKLSITTHSSETLKTYVEWAPTIASSIHKERYKKLTPSGVQIYHFKNDSSLSLFSCRVYLEKHDDIRLFINTNTFSSPYRHMEIAMDIHNLTFQNIPLNEISTLFSVRNKYIYIWIENISNRTIYYFPELSLTNDIHYNFSVIDLSFNPTSKSIFFYFNGSELINELKRTKPIQSNAFHMIELETFHNETEWIKYYYKMILLSKNYYPSAAKYDLISDKEIIERDYDDTVFIYQRLVYPVHINDIIESDIYRIVIFSLFNRKEEITILRSYVIHPEFIVLNESIPITFSILTNETWNLYNMTSSGNQTFIFKLTTEQSLDDFDVYSNHELFPTAETNEHETIKDIKSNTVSFCSFTNQYIFINIHNHYPSRRLNATISIRPVKTCNDKPKGNESKTIALVFLSLLGLVTVLLIVSLFFIRRVPSQTKYLTHNEIDAEKNKYMPLENESLKNPNPVDFSKIPFITQSINEQTEDSEMEDESFFISNQSKWNV